MSVIFGSGLIIRNHFWEQLKADASVRNARLQFEESTETYQIWFCDDGEVYTTTIYLGTVPYDISVTGYTQAQNDIDKADFEAQFKSNANKPVTIQQVDGATVVSVTGLEGDEVVYASHNFCMRTTWYGDSVRVTDETLTDSGDGLTWNSTHVNWIDMTHGYVLDEDGLREDVSHGYLIVVAVDDVAKTQRAPYATSGGDYDVNYVTGKVTFFASQAGKVVKASYSYENGSTWYLIPAAGKALDISESEVQFSSDVIINDTIRVSTWGNVEVFAPQLWSGNGGPLPTGTKIELQIQRYIRRNQMVDEARGSFPVIPPNGGSVRGATKDILNFPFIYTAVKRLWSKYGMETRINLESNLVFDGEHATGTFYMRSRDESAL